MHGSVLKENDWFVHYGSNGTPNGTTFTFRVPDNLEMLKLEKKRERNRIAATKCRQRKLDKIRTLGQFPELSVGCFKNVSFLNKVVLAGERARDLLILSTLPLSHSHFKSPLNGSAILVSRCGGALEG
jgi:hypothetical protein